MMIRFIFVCMALVAVTILTISGQFMLDGIKAAKEGVTARNQTALENQTASVQPSGPTFEEIYANAPVQATSPEDLNNIATTAGGNDDGGFKGGFTNVAPKALGDAQPASPVADETQAAEPASN